MRSCFYPDAAEKRIRSALGLVFLAALLALITGALEARGASAPASAGYMWYYLPHERGRRPEPMEKAPYLKKFIESGDVYYAGDTDEKVIYITFDDCPPNENISELLDALEKHGAPAAFFMTRNYIVKNPGVIQRIVRGGRLVCNHTTNHVDVTGLKREQFVSELKGVEDAYRDATGRELPKYFRPPQGRFNEETLNMAREAGYVTVFWSFRYEDWDLRRQPSEQSAFDAIIGETHPGEIALFHCQSRTNVKILDRVLTEWERMGYSFGSLDRLTGRAGRVVQAH